MVSGPQQTSLDFLTTMRELHATLKEEIRYAQEVQQEQADRHRLPAPAFQIGE
jgi:hypothetical protein